MIATIVRLLLLQSLGNENPFIVFYPAVAVAAFVGGFGPGIVATLLSLVVAHYFWLDPALRRWLDPVELLSMSIFLAGGVVVSYMALVVERARKRQVAAETAAAVARADLETKEREERFDILSSVTLEGVVISQGGVILDVNDQFCRLLGYEKSELAGKKIEDLILNPQDLSQALERIRAGVESFAEYQLLRKDGTVVVVEAHGRNSVSRDGSSLRITSIRDITSRFQQQQELRMERETLALFVEHAPVALAMFDCEMRYICASRRWINNYQLGMVDVKGLSHYEVFPDIKEEWREAHRRGLSGETVACEGDRFERENGVVLWINWEVDPWYQSDGSVGGIIIFSEDVTRQKQDEEQLKELTQRLTYHMENSPLAVIEWGADMTVVRWGGAAERIFGWKAEEVLGKKLEDLRWVYEEDRTQVDEVTADLTSGANSTRFSANRNYRRDGTVAFCEWYNSSLLDDSGRLRSILSLVLDVTERKDLEESLKRYSENLEATVKERTDELMQKNQLLFHQSRLAAMGEMINTIAHQWRQPLNVLGLHIQSLPKLCELDPQTDVKAVASDCMKLISHMSATIDDFRDFFRPDREKQDFFINGALRRAVDLVASGYRQSNIEIETRLAGDAVVTGYPNQFAQAVLCVLQNARDALLEHGVEQGRVVMTSFAAENRVVVTIADNAGGVPEKIKARIFEPYFTTKGEAGTGIGLFMARTIIEAMAGDISVRNLEDGAEFTIRVPVKEFRF